MPLQKMLLLKHAPTVTINPEFIDLGTQAYEDTYDRMRSLVQAKSLNDQIWLLEHSPVFTLGTAADSSHVLNPGSIPVIQTDRGGEVTFHGPGQLVMYFLLNIQLKNMGLKVLSLRVLQECMLKKKKLHPLVLESPKAKVIMGLALTLTWILNLLA